MRISLDQIHARLLRIENMVFGNNSEGWNPITLDAGWTTVVTCQYMMLPNGLVIVRGQASHATMSTVTNINSSNPLPSAYWPGDNRNYKGGLVGVSAQIEMSTAGILIARVGTSTATDASLDGIYSL
jgi:hypothetical protein